MLLTKLKSTTAALLATVMLLVGLGVASSVAAEQAPAAGDNKQEVKIKWQYKALSPDNIEKLAPRESKDKLTDGLNTLGEQGWELVTVDRSANLGGLGGAVYPSIYVFKRQK